MWYNRRGDDKDVSLQMLRPFLRMRVDFTSRFRRLLTRAVSVPALNMTLRPAT